MNKKNKVEELFSLEGKFALITGGAGLLGRQHAEIIAEAGGIPLIADISPNCEAVAQSIRQKYNIPAQALLLDITKKDQVDSAIQQFPRIDILINNAALTVKGGSDQAGDYFAPFEEYPLHYWQEALNVNLTGMFLITQAVGKLMVKNGGGVILNMASDVGMISPDHRIYKGVLNPHSKKPFNTPIAYSTTKAGVIQFTKYLATYWAEKGIRVNSLSPAGVFQDHEEKFVSALSHLIPLGRMAKVDEYQGAVLFLISPASSFMTGANLVVDGGRTAL